MSKYAANLPSRVPSLDGLRGTSIILVLWCHVLFSYGISTPWEIRLAGWLGGFGVNTFFVVSGFIITHLLLKERDRTGTLSLRSFYMRRVFRIFPAYYTLIVTVFLLQRLKVLQLPTSSVVAAGLFLSDYHKGITIWLEHTWSLSVEEQFYLLWPLTLYVLGPRRAKWVAVSLLLLVPAGRIATVMLFPPNHAAVAALRFGAHSRIDGIMYGCVAALFVGREEFRRRLVGFMEAGGAPLVFCGIVASCVLTIRWGFYSNAIGTSVDSLLAMLMLCWLVDRPATPVGQFFNQKWLVHIGLISFSLYLWQQLFVNHRTIPPVGRFPLSILCALAAAEIS